MGKESRGRVRGTCGKKGRVRGGEKGEGLRWGKGKG